MNRNFVLLEGFLGADPEMRTLPSGSRVANARIATNYVYEKAGKKTQVTSWHALVFYNHLAEEAVTWKKGENVHVEGMIQDRQFTPTGETKPKRVKEIIVESCHLIAPSRARLSENVPGGQDGDGTANDGQDSDDGWPA